MKELFFTFLVIFLIFSFFWAGDNPKQLNLDHKKDYVIVEINDGFWFGHVITLKHMHPDSTEIHYERVYEIVAQKLNVGDTIK